MTGNVLCIYHDNCPDGIVAAWAVKRFYPGCELHPASHGSRPPDCAARDVVMVDFTYPPADMLDVLAYARSLTVLDHHETGIANCAPLVGRIDPARLKLDMNRSGARIAWDYYHAGNTADALGFNLHADTGVIPDVVRFTEDRDLWRFQYTETKDYAAAFAARGFMIETVEELFSTPTLIVLAEGVAVNRYRDELIRQAVETAGFASINGHLIPAANCPYSYASDVASALTDASDIGVGAYWFDSFDEERVCWFRHWGLRAVSDFNVAELAARFGGGGHAKAAGFRQPISLPYVPGAY